LQKVELFCNTLQNAKHEKAAKIATFSHVAKRCITIETALLRRRSGVRVPAGSPSKKSSRMAALSAFLRPNGRSGYIYDEAMKQNGK